MGAVVTLTFVLAGAIAARTAGPMAQTPPPPPAKTTLDPIYTAAQAKRGEETYDGFCLDCHKRSAYTGEVFKTNWNGRPLSDLYGWVLDKMPKGDPGLLTPAESAEVVAFILQLNHAPAGKTALPADAAALAAILIQIK